MRLRAYRDKAHSGHLDITGETDHPWVIDLVAIAAAASLLIGFAAALGQHLIG